MTLLTATSCFGVELFMILEGSVDSPTWCYFITEVDIPFRFTDFLDSKISSTKIMQKKSRNEVIGYSLSLR